jgi:hypothetical protein
MELNRRKNVAANFDAPLVDSASPPDYKSSATLAAGDVKVIKDGGAPVNITSLPTEISTTGVYRFSLTASEMNATTIAVVCVDASGSEWNPLTVILNTALADELHLAKAALANTREHTIATGVDVIKDDDDSTAIRTLTPNESDGVITVTPS